jgi:ribosomal protein L37AE/L43A
VVELAEVFRQHGSAYRAKYGGRMPPSHRRAMRDIERCRTEVLGGHVYICPDCEQIQYSYHVEKPRHYGNYYRAHWQVII